MSKLNWNRQRPLSYAGEPPRRFQLGDPRWIVIKFPDRCAHCRRHVNPGESVKWYPRDSTVLCKACG